MNNKTSKTIATHNGPMHADDVCGVMFLNEVVANAIIVRSRDPKVVADADFAVDVGSIYDAKAGKFDHHQKSFTERRGDTTGKYASAGLVWAEHGPAFISAVMPEAHNLRYAISALIDEQLIRHIDAADTGEDNPAKGHFGFSMLIDGFNPTHAEIVSAQAEGVDEDTVRLAKFREAMDFARKVFVREVHKTFENVAGQAKVRQAVEHSDGAILVMPEPGLHWKSVVCRERPAARFVIFEDTNNKTFMVQTVPVEPESFVSRKLFPDTWAGLRDANLAIVTNVPDSLFCHSDLFIAGAYSLQGALKMAEQALAA